MLEFIVFFSFSIMLKNNRVCKKSIRVNIKKNNKKKQRITTLHMCLWSGWGVLSPQMLCLLYSCEHMMFNVVTLMLY